MPSLKDWNYFIRPNLIIPLVAIYLIGYFSSKSLLFNLDFWMGVTIAILMYIASITVNHYFDYETDKKSKDIYRFPVARDVFSKKFTAYFSFWMVVLAIYFSLFLNPLSQYIVLLGIFWLIAYSAPPFRIKTKPFLEIFWNGVGYGFLPFYLALSTTTYNLNSNIVLLSLIPFFVTMSGHILLQVPDIETDRGNRLKTTNAVYGKKFAVNLSRILITLAGLIIIYLFYINFLNILSLASIAAGAFIIYYHKRMKLVRDIRKTYRPVQIAYLIGGILFILSII